MCRRSTTPFSPCSAPIGSWIATQRSESCARAASSARKKSARSRSSMFTKTTRDSSYSSARAQTRAVFTSTPITPLRTTSPPSTTRRAAYVSTWNPVSPGQSIRLIFRSRHSRWASEPDNDIWRRCSSSSQSATVVPCSIEPSRFVFPAWNSIASTSEVFPTPRWPITAMLRILAGSVSGIRLVSSLARWFGGIVSPREHPTGASSRRDVLRAERGARGRAAEAGLEAQNRLRVQLRDAGLGHAENLPDLAERQLLVVVERDDELLALGQARDRLDDRLAHLGLRQCPLRVGRLGVLDRVDQGDLVAVRPGDCPELVQGGNRGAGNLGEALVELPGRDADLLLDLLVGRYAPGLRLELADRALDVARTGADRARNPVHRAQLVDDRAADARDRVRLELDVAVGLEALDRPDQPEQPVRDEVALVYVRRQAAAEPPGHVLDERRVVEDQPVAERLVARPAVLEPQSLRLVEALHRRRIRCGRRISLTGAGMRLARARRATRRARAPPPRRPSRGHRRRRRSAPPLRRRSGPRQGR